jgi:hypothetical protein
MYLLSLGAGFLLAVGCGSGKTSSGPQASVLTYHNDNSRDGVNTMESQLTPKNVNTTNFGKLAGLPVDGIVYAQPLFTKVTINGTSTNAVFVATEHDSVYAFNADSLSTTPLWHRSFLGDSFLACNQCSTLTSVQINAPNIEPEIGITATPAIDSTRGVIYVVASSFENGSFYVKLHALNLASGIEMPGSPVVVNPSLPGASTAAGVNSSGQITFDAQRQLPRGGVTFYNGSVYLVMSSYDDQEPSHGWVISYNGTTLAQTSAWMTSPNSGEANIWMSGDGPVMDTSGNLYFSVGNGDPENISTLDFSDCVVKLSTASGLKLADYFRPFNWLQLSVGGVDASGFNLGGGDVEIGSGGVVMLPTMSGAHPHELITGGKEGSLYVIDAENMGKAAPTGATSNPQIVQFLPHFLPGGKNYGPGIFSTPAFYNNHLYINGAGDVLRSIPTTNGMLTPSAMTVANEVIAQRGSSPSISSYLGANTMVWTLDSSAFTYAWNAQQYQVLTNGPAILRAYDVNNLSTVLYSSGTVSADASGNAVKFAVPTVANGMVFVGTQTELSVYGLKTWKPKAQAIEDLSREPASSSSFITRMWSSVKVFFGSLFGPK